MTRDDLHELAAMAHDLAATATEAAERNDDSAAPRDVLVKEAKKQVIAIVALLCGVSS